MLDCGLISNKQRGSLAKLPGLTGTRPGQTALGRWIAIVRSRAKGYAGSNLGRVSRIGRPGLVGRAGRRRYDADELSRGGAGQTSPDLAKSDAQGSNSTRVLVRGGVRDMRNPPRATAGFCRGRSVVRSSGGGAAVADLAGASGWATPVLGSGHNRVSVHVQG